MELTANKKQNTSNSVAPSRIWPCHSNCYRTGQCLDDEKFDRPGNGLGFACGSWWRWRHERGGQRQFAGRLKRNPITSYRSAFICSWRWRSYCCCCWRFFRNWSVRQQRRIPFHTLEKEIKKNYIFSNDDAAKKIEPANNRVDWTGLPLVPATPTGGHGPPVGGPRTPTGATVHPFP